MRKYKPEVVIVRRRRDGPRRARGQVGWRVVAFFLAAAVLTGAVAIAFNLRLEADWERAIARNLGPP
ncbi:MAG TPA: hypothetical protein VGC16_06475 [Rhizomicrobium sp.]